MKKINNIRYNIVDLCIHLFRRIVCLWRSSISSILSNGIFSFLKITSERSFFQKLLSWGQCLTPMAILTIVIFAAYAPSLNHHFRADHFKYLHYVQEKSGFWETWAASYSLTRQTDHGDPQLYRPFLYGLLALERALFGTNFIWYQLFGIVLHVINTCLLYAILKNLLHNWIIVYPEKRSCWNPLFWSPQNLPFIFALFFALNFMTCEMVLWSHIHGYLLFVTLVLTILLLIMGIIADSDAPKRRYVMVWCVLLISTFLYELGQVLAIFAGITLFMLASKGSVPRCRKYNILVAFAFIPLIYQIINRVDAICYKVPNYIIPLPYWNTGSVVQSFIYLFVQPFLSNSAIAQGRLLIPPVKTLFDAQILYSVTGLFVIFSLTLTAIYFAVRSLRNSDITSFIKSLIIIPIGLSVASWAAIVLRFSSHPMGIDLLYISNYYTYFTLLYLIISFACAFSMENRPFSSGLRVLISAIMISILFVSTHNAIKIYQLTNDYKNRCIPLVTMVKQMRQFISSKNNGLDYKIALDTKSLSTPEWFGTSMSPSLKTAFENLFWPYLGTDPSAAYMVIRNSQTSIIIANQNEFQPITFHDSSTPGETQSLAEKAFDNNPWTWWETPLGVEPVWLEAANAVNIQIIDYAFYSGLSDSTDYRKRMPKSWVLEGADDLKTWHEIHRVKDQIDWKTNETRHYHIPQPSAPYKHYKFIFTEGNDTILRICEIKLSPTTLGGTSHPSNIGNNTTEHISSTVDSNSPGGAKPDKIGITTSNNSQLLTPEETSAPNFTVINFQQKFSNGTFPFWEASGQYPHWIQVHFINQSKKVTDYTIQAHFDPMLTSRMPSDWLFQGSYNSIDWNDLDTRKRVTDWNVNEKKTFHVEKQGTYNFYRFYFTKGNQEDYIRIFSVALLY